MIKTLLLFILSCTRVSFDILRIVIIKALLPRMPPRNSCGGKGNISISVVQVDDDVGQVEDTLWKGASMSGPGHDFANGDGLEEAARFEVPNYAVLVDKVNVTPTKPSILGFEFSLYSNLDSAAAATAPQNSSTRHPFLTPVRQPRIKEVGSTILRNASDRVTEILRENRRRLDAGEDPNTIRKAARRKRAMELSAVRTGRAKPLSLALA